MNNHFIASEGKIWKSKITGDILSSELYLGKEDSIDNYEEIYKPLEEVNETVTL